MDRPEWVAVNPGTKDVYLTLTNGAGNGGAVEPAQAQPLRQHHPLAGEGRRQHLADLLHAEVAAALVALEPDLLAAVGDFVPALAPYAAQLGERLITAADPAALGPELARRLTGRELVVLKASRGVALERILPAVTTPRDAPHAEA